jgi:ABC-2 type transport system ATP-binding protein
MSDYAIETMGLSYSYGDLDAVDGLDLQVPIGSVFGLLGPNGAGKSTTIHMLMGLLTPTAGRASVLGTDPAVDEVAVRQRVGFVAEQHGFFEKLSIRETIALVAPYHERWNQQLCKELIHEFELPSDSQVRTLSKGMRAKLALLLALSHDPDLLILDEPAGGLDPAARRRFVETILRHFQASGRTIFVSSHLLNDFAGLLDHVAFLRDGRLELQTSVEDLHARTRRVRLIFEDGVPADIRIPDALSVRIQGREVVAVYDAFEGDETLAALARLNPSHHLVETLTLEDIFVERVQA